MDQDIPHCTARNVSNKEKLVTIHSFIVMLTHLVHSLEPVTSSNQARYYLRSFLNPVHKNFKMFNAVIS